MTQEVQPLTWQKRTNIEEHQQFFSKINEIIANLAPTVDEAEQAIAQATQALTDATAAIATANAASAAADAAAQSAQAAAATVAGYDSRLTAVEGEADTNADNITALQGRMGTAEGNITALQGVQADYVKKDGADQTVTSRIMVPTTATGTRDTQIANGTRIQNDLAAYELMVRTENNQNMTGVKNNTTMMTGQVWGGGQTVRWIRLAYSTSNDVAFFGTAIPEKNTSVNNSMRFWIIARSSTIIFRYQNVFGTLATDRYVMTYDGTKYEFWFHYPVEGTNNRVCVNFEGGNQRNFVFDGETTKETLDPDDYVLYVTPTAVS